MTKDTKGKTMKRGMEDGRNKGKEQVGRREREKGKTRLVYAQTSHQTAGKTRQLCLYACVFYNYREKKIQLFIQVTNTTYLM